MTIKELDKVRVGDKIIFTNKGLFNGKGIYPPQNAIVTVRAKAGLKIYLQEYKLTEKNQGYSLARFSLYKRLPRNYVAAQRI